MAEREAVAPSPPAAAGRMRVALLAAACVAVVVGVTATVEATVAPYLPSASDRGSSTASSAPPSSPASLPPTSPATPAPPTTPRPSSVAPSTTPTSLPDPDGSGCSTAGTRVVRGGQDAALGLRLDSVVLEICGDEPVAVEGYPGLTLLDEAGRVLDVVVEQGEAQGAGDLDPGPAPLLLDPGERAVAVLTWRGTVDPGTTDTGTEVSTATAVVVTPRPGDEPLPPVPMPVDLGTTGELSVTAWQPDPVG